MVESNVIHLQPREEEAIQLFFENFQQDEEGDLCVPLFDSNSGKVYLYHDHARRYQIYALRRIYNLVKKNVFFIKVKKIKRNKKFLCMKKENVEKIKSILES